MRHPFVEPSFDQDSTYGHIWVWFQGLHGGSRYTDAELREIHARWRKLGKLARQVP